MKDHRGVAEQPVEDLRQVTPTDPAEGSGMDVRNREENLLLSFPLHDEGDLGYDHALADAPEEVIEFPAALGEVGEERVRQFEGADLEVRLHRAFDHDDEEEDSDCKADVEYDGELHEPQAKKRRCSRNSNAE